MGSTIDTLTFDVLDLDKSKETDAILAKRAADKRKSDAESARVAQAAKAEELKVQTRQEALKKTKRESAARKGRRSTILTGATGDQLGVTRPQATETLG